MDNRQKHDRMRIISLPPCYTMYAILFLLHTNMISSISAQTMLSGGYLSSPPARNYIAYLHNKHLPSSTKPLSILPQFEPSPHSLLTSNSEGGSTTCGSIDERDYDQPKSRMNTILPLNIQAIYPTGGTIQVKVNLFNVDDDHGGHFEFHVCPIHYPQIPTEECFDKYPLEFISDEYYGALKDEEYPTRVYIPSKSAFVGSKDNNNGTMMERVMSEQVGPDASSMMEFSYTLQLPQNEQELNIDYGVLEHNGIPNGDVEGSAFTQTITTTTSDEHFVINESLEEESNNNNNDHHDGRQRRRKQKWIGTQHGTSVTESLYETVILSSMSTDGNGTTTIITLNGDVTILENGPSK